MQRLIARSQSDALQVCDQDQLQHNTQQHIIIILFSSILMFCMHSICLHLGVLFIAHVLLTG